MGIATWGGGHACCRFNGNNNGKEPTKVDSFLISLDLNTLLYYNEKFKIGYRLKMINGENKNSLKANGTDEVILVWKIHWKMVVAIKLM
jgi:hypothetical protein